MREHCEQLPEGKVGKTGIKNVGVEITEREVSKSWNSRVEVAGMMHQKFVQNLWSKKTWCSKFSFASPILKENRRLGSLGKH